MRKLFIFSLIATTGLYSCKPEGCTDPIAVNYNADAEKDNGSCSYEANLAIWLDETTADLYESEDDDLYLFDIFLEGEKIGEHPLFRTKELFPDCGDTSCFNHTISMNSKNQNGLRIDFYDNLENHRGGFSFNIEGGECKVIPINYE